MRKNEVEKYLGRNVEIVLFDGEKVKGTLRILSDCNKKLTKKTAGEKKIGLLPCFTVSKFQFTGY